MDVYASEEEQIEAIKKWWKENGTSIVLGVVLGAGALFGWRYWESNNQRQAEVASTAYTTLERKIEEGKKAEIETSARALMEEYSETPYAALAALTLARQAVDDGNSEKAVSDLQWVRDNSKLPEITQTATLRLARLYLSEKDPGKARALIDPLLPEATTASVHELMGDILLAENKPDEAKTAYLQALALTPTSQSGLGGSAINSGNSLLEMKLDDLGSNE